MFTISWWRLQNTEHINKKMFYFQNNFTSRNKKITNASICLFQPFEKIKIAGGKPKRPSPIGFFPVISANIGISPKKFLTLNFNPSVSLV